jgi:hypothetical protein
MFERMNWLALSLALTTPFVLANSLEEELIAAATEVAAEAEAESYAELIDGDEVFEGLFTFYRDSETGETTMRLEPDSLKKNISTSFTSLTE